MRGFYQGGRFTPDYENESMRRGINEDLQRFSGTYAEWWVWDKATTEVDPLYDVGSYNDTGGRKWSGPFNLPIVRSVIKQGVTKISDKGFYNSDTLHLTVNAEDLELITPGVNPDLQDRGRVVWLGEVFRPYSVQQAGIVANRFALVVIECYQVMPDELVNDPQFAKYAGPQDTIVGYGAPEYGVNGYGY